MRRRRPRHADRLAVGHATYQPLSEYKRSSASPFYLILTNCRSTVLHPRDQRLSSEARLSMTPDRDESTFASGRGDTPGAAVNRDALPCACPRVGCCSCAPPRPISRVRGRAAPCCHIAFRSRTMRLLSSRASTQTERVETSGGWIVSSTTEERHAAVVPRKCGVGHPNPRLHGDLLRRDQVSSLLRTRPHGPCRPCDGCVDVARRTGTPRSLMRTATGANISDVANRRQEWTARAG